MELLDGFPDYKELAPIKNVAEEKRKFYVKLFFSVIDANNT